MAYTHQQLYKFYTDQGHDPNTANRMASQVMQAQTNAQAQPPVAQQPQPAQTSGGQVGGQLASTGLQAASGLAAAAPAAAAASPWLAAASLAVQGGMALDQHLTAKRLAERQDRLEEEARRKRELEEELMAGMPGGGIAGMPGSGTYSPYV
jgi:hypothetical protein